MKWKKIGSKIREPTYLTFFSNEMKKSQIKMVKSEKLIDLDPISDSPGPGTTTGVSI